MIDRSVSEVLREMADDGNMKTHSRDCWQWHEHCAMMRAADVIDELMETLAKRP